MTGNKERRQNIEAASESIGHAATHTKRGFHNTIQVVGRAITAVVSFATAVVDVVKAIAHVVGWAGSGISSAGNELLHEHSETTIEQIES